MPSDLVIVPAAERDLDEAFRYYEDRMVGLGDDFLERVAVALRQIAEFPEAKRLVTKTCRRSLIERFPYAIFYASDPGVVTIFGVLHTASGPGKWRRRLP